MNLSQKLDLDKANEETRAWRQDLEDKLLGPVVRVEFTLPDGTTHKDAFRMGHTIERLKAQIEVTQNIPYQQQDIYLGDKRLADPLCLTDYKVDPAQILQLTVKKREPQPDEKDD